MTTIGSTNIHKKLIEEEDMRTSIGSTQSQDSVAKNQIPKRLKKTFFCSLSLFIVGIILCTAGVVECIRWEDFWSGVSYFILSVLVLIPGTYYMFQFFRAKRTRDLEERRNILESIPEL